MTVMISKSYQDGVQPVSFNDIRIGRIEYKNGFYFWIPESLPYEGMHVPTTISHIIEHLECHLNWVIPYQMRAHEAGEKIDQNTLHPALRPYVVDTPSLGAMIKHPLLFWIGTDTFMHHAQVNGIFHEKRKRIKEAFEKEDWAYYIMMHERAYRLNAFLEIADEIASDAEYWNFFSTIWLDSENIHENYDDWLQIWTSDRPSRDNTMTKEEQRKLAAMPETISIFRGVSCQDAVHGLSWSLNKRKATWFASRFSFGDRTPLLVTATVAKKNVLAHFISRNEYK